MGKGLGLVDTIIHNLWSTRRPMKRAPQDLWREMGQEVLSHVRKKMSPATLGIVIATGLGHHPDEPRASLFQVHEGPCVSPYDNGRKQLHMLAATAIIARMSDLLHEEDKQKQVEQRAGQTRTSRTMI